MIRGWGVRVWAVAAVAVAAAATGLGVPAGAAQAPELPPLERGRGLHPNLASSLEDDVAVGAPVAPASAILDGELAPERGTPVTVVVEAGDPAAARAAVEAAGGTVTIELEDRVQADVPVAGLLAIAGAPGVTHVREPVAVLPAAQSEGVASTGGAAWHAGGDDGDGITVAIVDVGFAGHASRIGVAGELGDQVTTDFARCDDPDADNHGTAVAEIVHDMAPGAALHLVCIDTAEGFISALQSLPGLGVQVANGSIGIVGAGRGDGSGAENTTVAGAVRRLRREGVLYVGSAGNYGVDHYHQAAVGDGQGNDTTDFVNITANDSLDFAMPGTGLGQVTITWDQWTGPRTDFDLLVYHPSCPNDYLGVSALDQSQAGIPPFERVVFGRCGTRTTGYRVLVNRFSGTGTPRMDFYFDANATAPEIVTASSFVEPAAGEAAMSVGSHCVANGAAQPYSSRGPTIDGRIEPDISGPDANSGSVYGPASGCSNGFTGTSAAAPHVAGAAAVLLGSRPTMEPAHVQQMLESRAVDAGTAGRDNAFGTGRLLLGTPGNDMTPMPQLFTPMVPVRLYDTRPNRLGAAESPPRGSPVGPGQFLAVRVRDVAGVPATAVAVALNVTVVSPTASAHVSVQPETGPVTTSNLNFRAGQTVAQQVTATVGSSNSVRLFNAAGNSHLIVDVTGWYGPADGDAQPATGRFNALTAPVRAFDSRAAQGYAEVTNRTTRLASGEQVQLDLDRPGGIPVGATAAIVNLTVAQGTTSGHLTAFPADAAAPTTSNLNFGAGQTIANLAVVPLDALGRMRLRSEGSTHVIVDVIGWFQEGTGAGYVGLNPPRRVLDSRTGTGLRRGPVTAASHHDQLVGTYTGVPSNAEAVALGVIAVGPTANSHLTVYPTGQPLPPSSTLNFRAGHTVPNATVAGLGTQGRVRIVVAAGNVHVVADVSGYFLDPLLMPGPLG